MLLLGPEEQFTVIKLSGHSPKIANCFTNLYQRLGPDFTSDLIIVETTDHARLKIELTYNWRFDIDKNDFGKIFIVQDFIGDMCNNIGGKIRTTVA